MKNFINETSCVFVFHCLYLTKDIVNPASWKNAAKWDLLKCKKDSYREEMDHGL